MSHAHTNGELLDLPLRINIDIRFVSLLPTEIEIKNSQVMNTLFPIGASFEEKYPADDAKNLTAKSGQPPSAGLMMLQPEKPAVVLKSIKEAQSNNINSPRKTRPGQAKLPARTILSKNYGSDYVDSSDGHSPGALRKAEFILEAPTAGSVKLAGDFTHWEKRPIKMMHSTDGFWFTVVPLTPGQYAYRFIVDGEWWDDPRSTLRVPNPFGNDNAVKVVV